MSFSEGTSIFLEKLVFINTYTVAPAEAALSMTKTVEGLAPSVMGLAGGDFRFTLTNVHQASDKYSFEYTAETDGKAGYALALTYGYGTDGADGATGASSAPQREQNAPSGVSRPHLEQVII